MKLVANIQLKPTREQAAALKNTLERCNDACNWLSELAFANDTFKQYALHKRAYRNTRTKFGLTAQVAVRCIAKVADAYKPDKKVQRMFRKHAAQPYDDRIFRLIAKDQVSIWTLAGRLKIAFVCGERQRKLLAFRKGEVDLMLVRGKWYVACVCDVPDPKEIDIDGVLGIDLGIINLAFDSEGRAYTGAAVERTRIKFVKRRAGLQARGTKAAKRRLRKLSGKQRRFQTHTNHCISKALVETAQRSRSLIALEDLKHIRDRAKARRSQRNRLHNWAFGQLRQFVTYKARLAGIPINIVNPRNTSRTCCRCGIVDKKNRRTQDAFSCISCGHSESADLNAAKNIAFLARAALVTRPQVLTAHLAVGESLGL